MNKSVYLIIGFLLFIIGLLAIVLSVVGVQFAFLTWIDAPGRTFGFLVRLAMIIGGVIIIFLAQTDWEKERKEVEDA